MNRLATFKDEDSRFDRLVDGEMSDEERYRFLAALDDEPGGWRRCALAFLEDQAWRQSVRRAGPTDFLEERRSASAVDRATADLPRNLPPASPEVSAKPVDSDRRAAPAAHLCGLALAMAVCFLVAFFLGSEFRQRRLKPAPVPRGVVERPGAETNGPLVAGPSAAEAMPDKVDVLAPAEVVPWGEATFVVDDAGGQVEVPVFELDPEEAQVFVEQSAAVMDGLRHKLQQNGFDVQRVVRWSPVEMGGGQQMYVPVGDFEISLAANRTAQ